MKLSHPYPVLARLTLDRYLSKKIVNQNWPFQVEPNPSLWDTPTACFVSIKTNLGELRGCMGTIWPTRSNLGQEIMNNAISAGLQDPRFSPVTPEELQEVVFSVDVLSTPESISSPSQLNPAKWGVIVEKDGRRGLLLPALEGVNTVEEQLDIAARKAGLPGPQGAQLKRFSVDRYCEI